ncbi:MAG: bifunctional diaminohydroxyphosphoribosylaminopyrimidine deaminase/5-amino-6-(5-phosphoribosylamino)uracil reductase RibD [Flavobacterium sp.]
MNTHEKYMARCLELAQKGLGTTYPNPLVGSVIVHNNQIIGEGWHHKAGEAHAEVNAINSVKNKALLSEATLYVNLEPCSHFGKTPPCCDLLIDQQIPTVVIGSLDHHSKVNGSGIARLKSAGKEVIVGVLANECAQLNRRFFTFHQKKRPYIILKWAQSADGFIAPLTKTNRQPVWISNPLSRQRVHQWRTEEQAILVGTQTVLDDNPQLTARDWPGNNPLRIVLDQHGRLPKDSAVFDSTAETLVLSKNDLDFSNQIASQIADLLYHKNIQSVIVEGGRQTLQTFIDENYWDEARVFTGATNLVEGIPAPHIKACLATQEKINSDTLTFYYHDQEHYI